MVRYNNNWGVGIIGGCLEKQKIALFLGKQVSVIYLCEQCCYWYIYFRTLVLLNALLETFSCVYSEIMSNIISNFQKLIKGGVERRAGGWKIFQKLIRGDDYSVLESTLFVDISALMEEISILKPSLASTSKPELSDLSLTANALFRGISLVMSIT